MDLSHPITPPPEAWLDGRRVRLRASILSGRLLLALRFLPMITPS